MSLRVKPSFFLRVFDRLPGYIFVPSSQALGNPQVVWAGGVEVPRGPSCQALDIPPVVGRVLLARAALPGPRDGALRAGPGPSRVEFECVDDEEEVDADPEVVEEGEEERERLAG